MVSNYPSDVGYAWWLMEHFWTLIADAFAASGSKTFLAYPTITSLPEALSGSSITPIELEFPASSPWPMKNIRNFIQDNNIHYIYFTDRAWYNPRYAALRQAGVKKIVVHDHTPGDRPPVGGIKGLFKFIRHRLPFVCADSQLCVSELMRTRSIENGRLPAHRCHVVQNGIPPVQKTQRSRESLLRNLNIPTDSQICITTGRAHPYKRFDFIIDTAAALRQLNPDHSLVFLLIGDGPAYPELKQKVSDLGLDNRVLMPGFRTDARDFVSVADVAMHAALGEGFSLSIVEYMSAGLPVLVPDIPSVKQAIDHGKNGFVYEKNNCSNAAAFLNRLISDDQERRVMGSKAREKANSHYSLENCSREFKAVCRHVF
ncbi:MAG: glycosyltransferase family 4 protein [Marinobacter sp.]|uniref:glycosyltransferase family 4 protein n=1 Tax=Marinobacter sp. TaxID=50741 RepID=UPI00329A5C9D